MNYIFSLDTTLFFLINHLPHNLILDDFFGLLTFVGEAGAIWFLLTFLLFLKNQSRPGGTNLRIEVKKLAAIWLTGFFSFLLAFFLKEIFQRIRPEFILPNVILPFKPDSSFSFPSGHALTSFTLAYLLTKYYPKSDHKTKLSEARSGKLEIGNLFLYLLAVFISFSRIYLGYHYPLDVVGGAVIGIIVAKIAFRVLAIQKSP